MKRHFSIKKKLMIFFLVIIAAIAFGAVIMLLWNAILPEVIGVKSISFLQAVGILLLSKILFGGFHGGCGARRQKWMEMQQKMNAMTPEEKEKFKSEWKTRCGNRWKSGTAASE